MILYQGSGGTIGDLLLSSHFMYSQHLSGKEIAVAIPKSLRPELKAFYSYHTFLKRVVELDVLAGDPFLQYCKDNGYEPARYVVDVQYVKGTIFHPLKDWMNYIPQPSMRCDRCIGVHVASSSNYDRPAVPHLARYLEIIRHYGYFPVFIGTEKDKVLFDKLYPGVTGAVSREHWRFGKDTLFQTLSNIRDFSGMLTFSSWTAYAAVLQGVPCLELWNTDQWNMYSSYVRQMLGSPVHYLQDYFCDTPLEHLISEVFPYVRRQAASFYGQMK